MPLAQIVSMGSFKELGKTISPDVTLCVRGRHAVGKSEGVYQIASEVRSDFYKDSENCRRMLEAFGEVAYMDPSGHFRLVTKDEGWSYEMGIPVVERRLSQMTEGDVIGLPHSTKDGRATQFQACEWLIQASDFPVVLFLDERNRAIPQVKQAVFQLADSKVFYGNRLHADTRVYIAENTGENYQVEQNDPAEVSRAVTVELDPPEEEFFEFAKQHMHKATVEYLRQNPNNLEQKSHFAPNQKYPDRRAWMNLDKELQKSGMFKNPESHTFYVMAGAFVGTQVGGHFHEFVKQQYKQISAEEILSDWNKAKKKLGKKASNEDYVELVEKLGDYLGNNNVGQSEAEQVEAFMKDCPPEPRMSLFSRITENQDNLIMIHPYIGKLMVNTTTGKDLNSPLDGDDEKEDNTSSEESNKPSADNGNQKTKRGGGKKKKQ